MRELDSSDGRQLRAARCGVGGQGRAAGEPLAFDRGMWYMWVGDGEDGCWFCGEEGGVLREAVRANAAEGGWTPCVCVKLFKVI